MTYDVETDRRSRWLVVLLFAVLFVVLAAAAYAPPLYETDEGFAANRALSMLRHNSWILTYDEVDSDEPQFHKPPLLYMIIAGLYRIAGVSPFTARLPCVAASVGVCFLLFYFARRHLGTWCAVAAATLPLTVPFIFMHMSSAMLDMPFILCLLSSTLLFAERKGWKPAAAAGLLAGAAFLIKGAAGLAGVPLAIVIALFWREDRSGFVRDIAVLGVGAVLPLAAYFIALPAPYDAAAFKSLLVGETSQRLQPEGYDGRLAKTFVNVHGILLWHHVAGLLGLLLLAAGYKDLRIRRWFILTFFVVAVSILATASSKPPYPRYAIPGILLLLPATAYLCRRATDGSAARWLLLPLAVASLFVDASTLRWIPFTTCIAAFAAQSAPSQHVSRERLAPILATLLLAAMALPSALSPSAWHSIRRDHRWDAPDIIPLASQAGALVPEGSKVLLMGNFKCHAVLFYSRRAAESVQHWMEGSPQAGDVRYLIAMGRNPIALPGFEERVIARSGKFRLSRIEVESPTR